MDATKHRHELNPTNGNRECDVPESHTGKYNSDIAWAIDHAKAYAKCHEQNFIFTYNINTHALRAENIYSKHVSDPEKDGSDQTREGGTKPLYKHPDNGQPMPYTARTRDEFFYVFREMIEDIKHSKCTAFGGYVPNLEKLHARQDNLPEFSGGNLESVIDTLYSERTSGEIGRHRDGTPKSVDILAF